MSEEVAKVKEAAGQGRGGDMPGVTARGRSEALQAVQARVLEVAVQGTLAQTLEELVRMVEASSATGVLGSILLLSEDGAHLRHGAGPSLPDAYNEAIDGIAVGFGVGSCGTAAHTKAPVYVADIATDPLWTDFAELALSHDLRACWSIPIISGNGMVLATFAMYHREPRVPGPTDLEMVDFVIGTAALVIERKRVEERLRDSEELLRLAAEAAEVGFWDLDPRADSLFWPPRVKAMFGISADLSISMADFYAGLHPDDTEATTAAFAAALDPDRRALYDVEYRTVGKEDGLIRWVAAKGRGVFDARGTCTRVLGTAIEITSRKATEQALLDLNATLESRVASALAEQSQAEEGLRQAQKMEAVGQLTGGVAHDFNNLLTVIRGSVDLLRRDDLTSDRRKRYIDAIGDTADRAATLTGQLLAFARRQALKPETFDVGASIADAANIVRTLTGSRIEVELQTPVEPVFALADRSQLDTAIVNMAINARDAMNSDGRLIIATGTVSGIPEIRAHAAVAGDFVAVTITDTGSGIAADRLRFIFEPFFTTKGVGQGTGLGLSQVFGFAKQSGGDIRVESDEGKGTTFTLYLPRAYPEKTEDDLDEQEPQIGGDGLCVLVVEDNEGVGAFATDALKELGYDSIRASDAEQALAKLAECSSRFNIVFSDVVMPGMGGLELATRIRREYPTLPVVLTSGYSHVLAENGKHGFELLHKPYSIEQLSRVLRKAIAWHNRRR